MKQLFIIAYILVLSFNSKAQVSDPYIVKVVDSLLAKGGDSDTVIVYYRGCVGCRKDANTAYIFWDKGKRSLVVETPFLTWDKRKRKEVLWQTPRRAYDAQWSHLLYHYQQHAAAIDTQTLKDDGMYFHYSYAELTVASKGHTITRTVPNYDRILNDDTPLVNWLYRIESFIFNRDLK